MESCPCCFLEYDVLDNKIERVQLHKWVEVANESAKHWICNMCHIQISGLRRSKHKCPHCRISLRTPGDDHYYPTITTSSSFPMHYVSTAIQPYVPRGTDIPLRPPTYRGTQ